MKLTSSVAFIILTLLLIGFGYLAYRSESLHSDTLKATSETYLCQENKIIGAKFYSVTNEKPKAVQPGEIPVPTGFVDITLSDGRSMRLTQTISASGVRYANKDESFIFWTKGTSAMVLENGKTSESYIDCEVRAPSQSGTASTTKFLYDNERFSIILPRFTIAPELSRTDSYLVDEAYTYGLIPGENIQGVKFTIPAALSNKTNLSKDSYLSVEHIDNVKKCTADIFLEGEHPITYMKERGTDYTVASSSGAGAGNRYDETVYATQSKNTCYGIRYYIHYTVFENYPPGTIIRFNQQSLLNAFDQIRKSLTIQN